MRTRLLDEADAEFTQIAQRYENERKGLGEIFIAEVIDAFIDIERHPKRFSLSLKRGKRELRQRSLNHFPHSVVYEVLESECIIVAIAHPSRRPNYWRKRLT
jgi:hypothetical protein